MARSNGAIPDRLDEAATKRWLVSELGMDVKHAEALAGLARAEEKHVRAERELVNRHAQRQGTTPRRQATQPSRRNVTPIRGNARDWQNEVDTLLRQAEALIEENGLHGVCRRMIRSGDPLKARAATGVIAAEMARTQARRLAWLRANG